MKFAQQDWNRLAFAYARTYWATDFNFCFASGQCQCINSDTWHYSREWRRYTLTANEAFANVFIFSLMFTKTNKMNHWCLITWTEYLQLILLLFFSNYIKQVFAFWSLVVFIHLARAACQRQINLCVTDDFCTLKFTLAAKQVGYFGDRVDQR